ncbi:MAG: hypothetical protein IPG56_18875 [Caulobacteraceae bacterium]|nr:hypothetical protein [Caulobacteraceae bacterium]
MIGLIISEVILFAVAALLGFALGWRCLRMLAAQRRRTRAARDRQTAQRAE